MKVVRAALLAAALVAALVLVAACGGKPPAKNSIGGSTVNQLTRCTPRDTTHACDLSKHPKGAVPNVPAPLSAPLPPRASRAPKLSSDLAAPVVFNQQRGIDFAWSCPDPRNIDGAPVDFGVSYVSPDSSKNWSKQCLDWYLYSLHRRVGINFESNGTTPADGWGAGNADAALAKQQAAYLLPGAPVVIIFSIDFDASCTQTFAYFQGVANQLPLSRIGVYGGITPVRCLFNAGLVSHGWQAYAWSYGQWEPRALLEQWLNGNAWDYDRTIGADDGLWPPVAPPPDPYRILDTHVWDLPYGQHASERATVRTFEQAACKNPVRRLVCKSSRWHLQLLRDRDVWVARHALTPHGWVVLKHPAWARNGIGKRVHRIEFDLTH